MNLLSRINARSFFLVPLFLAAALLLAACQPAAVVTPDPTLIPTDIPIPVTAATEEPTAVPTVPAVEPGIEVQDQAVQNGAVTVAKVTSDGAGWLVLHADADGKPGPVIGQSAVQDGENVDVAVRIDTSKATETLHAMLHTDAGEVGTYEFPGADAPVMVNEQMVATSFSVRGLATRAPAYTYEEEDLYPAEEPAAAPAVPAAAGSARVETAQKDGLGTFLVDDKGMTLYLFTQDQPDVSNCKDQCLVNWPPFLTEGEPVAGEGVDADKLGTTKLDDGSTIVTYDRMPLYYWIADQQPGDTSGQGVGGVWFVVEP